MHQGRELNVPTGFGGVDGKLSLPPQLPFQGPPAKETWGPVSYTQTHVFHFSPYQLGQKQPCSLMTGRMPSDVGKPLPAVGLCLPTGAVSSRTGFSVRSSLVVPWLYRSPAQSGHQHPFFLEGLRDPLWIQVRGISLGDTPYCHPFSWGYLWLGRPKAGRAGQVDHNDHCEGRREGPGILPSAGIPLPRLPVHPPPPRMSVVSLQMQSPWEGRREAPTPGLSRNTEH